MRTGQVGRLIALIIATPIAMFLIEAAPRTPD